ncbi:MAG TPA: SAM-dependent methyltransferase [Terriglobales bacterium]|nr:SAM-dependent methyltransferase [Terriglobales bacterium]
MPGSLPLIRNISDTALWVAYYRALESERPDGLFRDPYARQLAGERGAAIAASQPFLDQNAWSLLARTYLFDQFIHQEVALGADLVVNLAAGLDARPYRMSLPATLHWIEVDLPAILDYKEEVLSTEKPGCMLERVRLDLTDGAARRSWLEQLGAGKRRALVLSEGLIIYLYEQQVVELARELAAAGLQRWVTDLASPGLLRLMVKHMGAGVDAANAMFRFAPEEGPDFFLPHGWKLADMRSPLKTAARFRRLPNWGLRFAALLPDSRGRAPRRPWSGICEFAPAGPVTP